MAESRLSITIDSQSAEQRAEQLRRKMEALERGGERVTQTFSGVNSELQGQREDLGRLLGQIDPVVGKLGQLDKMEQQLRKHHKQGILPTDDFNQYLGKLNASREALGNFDSQMKRASNTAGQTSQAMRQLPMQFTDIWVSLAAGQNPMTVFIQQGTQIRDSFGGVGPALKETAKYALGIVNPFTVGAAAIGAAGVAAYQGADEFEKFNQALALVGPSAGVTADELVALSEQLDGMAGVTQRSASAALNEVVKSGKFTSDQLEYVTRTALEMKRATGQSIQDTVDAFSELADDPVQAIDKLNQEHGFLTESVYRQIQALQESGDTVEAQRLAMSTYADTMRERARNVSDNIGWIQKAWRGVTGAASEAWDEMLGIGRATTIDDQIEGLQRRLQGVADSGSADLTFGISTTATNDEERKQLSAQIALLQGIKAGEMAVTRAKKEQQEIENARIADLREVNDLNDKYADKQRQIAQIEAERDRLLGAYNLYGDEKYLRAYEEAQRKLNEALKDPDAERAAKEAAREAAKANREAEKAAREHAKAIEAVQKQYQSLMSSLYPIKAANDDYIESQLLLQTAWDGSAESAGRLIDAMGRLNEAQMSSQTASQAYSGGFGSEIGSRGGIGAPTDPAHVKELNEELAKSNDYAKDLGLSFQSAFEDAVIEGNNFRDVLGGILEDIERILLRQSVTTPLANALGGYDFGSLFSFGSSSAGTYTGGSPGSLYAATGGYISGPGTSTSDSIPARLSDGEFAVNAKATKANRPLLESINAQRFATGGYVGGGSSALSSSSAGGMTVNTTVNVSPPAGMSDKQSSEFAEKIAKQTSSINVKEFKKLLYAETKPTGIVYRAVRNGGSATGY